MRSLLALVAIVANWIPAPACTFCAGGTASRPSLRQHLAGSKVVLHGTLENARPDPAGLGGTTDLRVSSTLKADKAFTTPTVATLPRYVPTVGTGSKEYLAFCDLVDGKLDLVTGVPATAATAEYLAAAAKLDPKDTTAALAFFFKYLDSKDATVSADAFLEFARATDAEVAAAAAHLDRAKVRAWLADPATPAERLGVYAMLLGLAGKREDAPYLRSLLDQAPTSDRVSANLGGVLAGYTLLDSKSGWAAVEAVLGDAKAGPDKKLAAVGVARFFQAAKPKEAKPAILHAYSVAVTTGDAADMAVEDLRRWGWWDLTTDVLGSFDKKTHAAPITRRAIVRYALSCPGDDAKAFVAKVRKVDSTLVEEVEEGLKLYSVPKK
jgi:hypothetical protein